MTNNEKAKVMRSTQCVRDYTIWDEAQLVAASPRESPLFEQDMVKFSDFDYKNDRNHTTFLFKAQISRYILIFILFYHYLFFTFHGALPSLTTRPYVYVIWSTDPFSTAGRFTATEQTYHSPTSVWFQNERILGGGCHYCGSTRSQVQMGLVLTS